MGCRSGFIRMRRWRFKTNVFFAINVEINTKVNETNRILILETKIIPWKAI